MKRIRVVVGSDNSKKVSREHCKLLWVWASCPTKGCDCLI